MTAALAITEDAGGITFDVQVVPRASRDRLGPVDLHGGRLKVHVTAPPVDGAANEALVALVAKALDRPRSAVTIVRGLTGRKKTVRVGGSSRAQLLSHIEDS
jgi:uncharacterized protein (TIGR00251 family)